MHVRQRAVRSDLVRDEAPWVELVDDVGLALVRDLLVDAGIARPKAAAIAFWLTDQSNRFRQAGPAGAAEAKRYRAALREIGPPPRARIGSRAIPGYLKRAA